MSGVVLVPAEHDGKHRIKVFLLLTSTAGGAGLQTYYLAKFLPELGFDVTVGFGPGYPLDSDFDELGLPIHRFSISRKISPLTNTRGFFELLVFLRHHQFDIICTACSIAGLLGRVAGWFARVPVRIMVLHLYASHAQQSWYKRVFFHAVEKALDPLTTRYVAVSEAGKAFGVKNRLMSPDKVQVIVNAVEMHDRHTSKAQARADLGLDPDGLVVGTLSRCEPQKGLFFLLQSAEMVCKARPNVQFLVAGDGPLLDQLKTEATRLGLGDAVRLVGWRSDTARVLSAMDVFCLSSLWEQAPMSLLEAMSVGLPVVATRVGGVSEMVDEGHTGLLVKPQDATALANALTVLLTDDSLRCRMGKAGRRRVEAEFAIDEMVRRYGDLFRWHHADAWGMDKGQSEKQVKNESEAGL